MKGESLGYNSVQHAFIFKHKCMHCGRAFRSKVEDEDAPMCSRCFHGDVSEPRRKAKVAMKKLKRLKATPE